MKPVRIVWQSGDSTRFDHGEVLVNGWVIARQNGEPLIQYPPHRIAEIERLE